MSPTFYYYLKDHLGNVRVVFTPNADNTPAFVQANDYYPFGMAYTKNLPVQGGSGTTTTTTYVNKFLYNGKEEQDMPGKWLDYGARFYDPQVGRWHSVDPLGEKMFSWSPYNFTTNNPIRFIDPSGKEVEAIDKQSKKNIKNSLSKDEGKYVRFNKNGILNSKRLNKSKSTSKNITSLKSLANSETKYVFSTDIQYSSGKEVIPLVEDNGNGIKGVTLIPNAEIDPSPDGNVHIITSKNLSLEKQASNAAHEGYGHAYFYELKQQGLDVNPYHDYKSVILGTEWDSEFNITVPIFGWEDRNTKLANHIKKVEEQAIKNFKSRRKYK